MGLTNDQVEEAVQRYWREYDRYTKLSQLVGETCRELMRDNLIRASVHWRAKSLDSFRRKVTQKYASQVQTVDELFSRVGDLAAARVLTYVEEDRTQVVELLTRTFVAPSGKDAVHVDRKDKEDGKSFYRATHCQLAVADSKLIGLYDNLRGLSCEVQVCSLLAHVWNELEHDLVYKPLAGVASKEEHQLLGVLGHETLAGDGVIIRLLDATTRRQRQEQDPFSDAYDFVARTRPLFPGVSDFHLYAEQLFTELAALGIDSPQKLREAVLKDHAKPAEEGRAMLTEFHGKVSSRWSDAYSPLTEQSSDVLMALVFAKYVGKIVDNNKVGRGQGRPQRIVFAARLWKSSAEGA